MLELDPDNAPAKKELASIAKQIKVANQKDREAYGNIFSKGSVYDDKEKERKLKLQREEAARLKEMDDWTKSKVMAKRLK